MMEAKQKKVFEILYRVGAGVVFFAVFVLAPFVVMPVLEILKGVHTVELPERVTDQNPSIRKEIFKYPGSIPTLKDPTLVSVDRGDAIATGGRGGFFAVDDEYVFLPLSVLQMYQIVELEVADTPILATYSPITNTFQVFLRNNDEHFLVSNYHIDGSMLMTNHEGDKLWLQYTGELVYPENRNLVLPRLESAITSLDNQPTKVVGMTKTISRRELSPLFTYSTGVYDRFIGKHTVVGGEIDSRLPAHEMVLFAKAPSGKIIAYPYSKVGTDKIYDSIEGVSVTISPVSSTETGEMIDLLLEVNDEHANQEIVSFKSYWAYGQNTVRAVYGIDSDEVEVR